MRFLLNKRLHVNMGNYEHVELTASIEIDTEKDLDLLEEHQVDVEDPTKVMSFARSLVNEFLASDVEEAHYETANADSFIHDHHKNTKEHRQ